MNVFVEGDFTQLDNNDNTPDSSTTPQYTQEDYLLFAQARRIKFVQAVEKAVGNEEGLATLDPDRQANYLAAIRDLEKQVFTQQKLKQEEEDSEVRNAMIASLIVKKASEINTERTRGLDTIIPNPSVLPVKKLIPGETEIGDRIENFQEYKIRTGQCDHPDPLSEFASQ